VNPDCPQPDHPAPRPIRGRGFSHHFPRNRVPPAPRTAPVRSRSFHSTSWPWPVPATHRAVSDRDRDLPPAWWVAGTRPAMTDGGGF